MSLLQLGHQATVALAILVISILVFYWRRYKHYQDYRKHFGPNGPKPNLIDGCFSLVLASDNLITEFEKYTKVFGKIFNIFVGDYFCFVSTDQDLVRQITLEQPQAFVQRVTVPIEFPINHSLLLCQYDRWKVVRTLLDPELRKFNSKNDVLFKSQQLLLKYIEGKFEESSIKRVSIDVQPLMKSYALFNISNIANRLPNLQISENEPIVKELHAFWKDMLSSGLRFIFMFPFLESVLKVLVGYIKFGGVMAKIDKATNETIENGLKELKSGKSAEEYLKMDPQVIDHMIRFHHEGKISRLEVFGNAQLMTLAGSDTTGMALTFIFWALSKYQDIQDKLREEIRAHGLESKYLEQVIKESLRMWPVVDIGLVRQSSRTVELRGLTVPKDTHIMFSFYHIHRDPKNWPNPDIFDPERFREGVTIDPCIYLPFGIGGHRCPGMKLALLEIKMVVSSLLMHYKVYLKAPQSLNLTTFGLLLTQPSEKVVIELERLSH